MAPDDDQLDPRLLWHLPLLKLNIDVRLRRMLINAGFGSLGEAFDLSDRELDSRIGPDATDNILILEESFKRNPDAFIERITKKTTLSNGSRTSILTQVTRPPRPQKQSERRTYTRPQDSHTRNSVHLPNCNEAKALREFEKKAHSTLLIVADHAEDTFMAEALGMISTDIPSLRANVKKLFSRCQKLSNTNSSKAAVMGLGAETPDSFLLYMLDSVQRNFTGSAAWKPALAELGITDHTSEHEIKRLLYTHIQQWGFKTYDDDETELKYYYTILLHAGLAMSDWESIWDRLMIPLARDIERGRLPDGTYPSSRALIRLANDKHSGYHLANKSAQNLIAKAPDIVGPLLSEALSIAETLVRNSTDNKNAIMMSRGALPTLSMKALDKVLSKKETKRSKRSTSQLVYLPPAELRLNPSNSKMPMQLHWDLTRFPKKYAGRTVTYRINGTICCTAEIMTGVNSAVLTERLIELEAFRTYDIEIELSKPEESAEGKLFSSQSFKENRPGIYEFIRMPDGILRQKIRPLRKRRDVLCLIAPGFKIIPRNGMELVNSEVLTGGYSIQTFDMSVMGCGEVYDPSENQVSAWCEGFKITIDRSQLVGEGKEGSDLYPMIGEAEKVDYNAALPAITIESLSAAFESAQLTVDCLCDGNRVSVKRSASQDASTGGTSITVLRLDQSVFPAFVNEGRLRVTHPNTESQILNYRFSIAPIRRVSLESARVDGDTVMSTYAFLVNRACRLRWNDSSITASRTIPEYLDVPLSDEYLSLGIASLDDDDGPEVTAYVFLAGIDVSAPRAVSVTDGKMHDRHDLAKMAREDTTVSIESRGRRSHRGVLLSLGQVPVFYKLLSVESKYLISFLHPIPNAGENDGDQKTSLTLRLSYDCGHRREEDDIPSCDLDLGSLLLGYGFGRCELRYGTRGSSLFLSNPLTYDLHARFSVQRHARDRIICGDVLVPSGSTEIPLPWTALHALAKAGQLYVTFADEDLFGYTDFNSGQRIKIKG